MANDRHGKHNKPTIAFRVTPYEQQVINERVKISQKSLWIQWNLLNPNQRENLVVRDLSLQKGQTFHLKYQKRWNRKCHFVKERGLRT